MKPCRTSDVAGVLARWVVGGLFIYMGLSKALNPPDFLKLLRQYELTQNPWLLNSVAATLPWFEVFCGALLVAGVAVRGAALTLIAMLVPFTVTVLHRALAIKAASAIPFCAIKFDCGCGTGEEYICQKVLQNLLFLLLAGLLVAGKGRLFSLRYQAWSGEDGN